MILSRFVPGIEDFIYRRSTAYGNKHVFFLKSAGITHPCKEYLVERTRSKTDTESLYTFEYVVSGKGYIECEEKKYAVGAGDFYFLHRLHSHMYYPDPDDPYEKIWINAGGRLLDGVTNAYGMTDGVLIVPNSSIRPQIEQVHSLLVGIKLQNAQDIMTECAKIMCNIIITAATEYHKVQQTTVSTAEKIKDYIDSGLAYNVSLDDIAQHFYLNKSYIISIFSAKYGFTPKQYILDRKMQAARTMLEKNRHSVSEIADILNFSSSQHFSSSFKKKVGVSPDEYRRKKHK